MSTPNISIIIPVYNSEKFLEKTLLSVQNQTYKDFEVICVNDGSSDSSAKILEKFALKDDRFKIYHQENKGGSVARNNALELARGNYIAFLDNDDLYHPQYLEILYQNLIKYGADISVCNYTEFSENEDFVFSEVCEKNMVKFLSSNPFYDKFYHKKKIPMLMWTKLYKADLFKDIHFSSRLPAVNDVLLNLEILLKSKKLVFNDVSLVAYRQVSGSQTREKISDKKLNEYKNLIEEVMLLAAKQKNLHFKKILEKLASKYGWGLLVKDNLKKGKYIAGEENYHMTVNILKELCDKKVFNPRLLGLFQYWKYRRFMSGKYIDCCQRYLRKENF